MKKSLKTLFVSLILICSIAFVQTSLAQDPEPPHPPSAKGTSTNHGPADVPVGSGLYILLVMGAAYGAAKLYLMRSKTSITG